MTLPESTPRNYAERWYAIIIFATSVILWGGILMGQSLGTDVERWMLFLIPGEIVSDWFDGPVGFAGIVQRLGILIAAVLAVVPALVGGMLFSRHLIWVRTLERGERLVVALVAGMALQATTLMFWGALGIYRTMLLNLLWPGLTVALGYGLGYAAKYIQRERRREETVTVEGKKGARRRSGKGHSRYLLWLPRGLFVALSGLLIARAILPPVEYDVREYHLQGPKQWWLDGQLTFLAENIYANMPMGAEIHSVAAMQVLALVLPPEDAWWYGMLSGKVLIAMNLIWMALLVGAVLRILTQDTRKETRWIRQWGRVFAIGFPALFEQGSLGLIEPALASYLAWALLAWTATMRKGGEVQQLLERSAFTSLFFSLCFAGGGAIGCKYTAVILIFPILLALGWIAIKEGSGDRKIKWQTPQVFLLASVLFITAGGSWLVKNAVLAGNPVYPLAASQLGGMTMTPEKIAQWNSAHQVPGYGISEIFESLANVSWRWRLQGWVLLPLAVTATFTSKRTSEVMGLLAMIFSAFGIWWVLTHRVDRFLSPLIPLVVVLAGLGLQQLTSLFERKSLAIILGLLVFCNLYYVAGPAIGDSRIAVDLGYLRVDDSTKSGVSRLPEHVVWVNKNLRAQDRLLVVGDAAVVDYEMPIAYATTFDTCPLIRYLDSGKDEAGASLEQDGFTHVLIAWGEIERLRSTYGFDERLDREAIETFVEKGILRRIESGLAGERAEIFQVVSTTSQTQ